MLAGYQRFVAYVYEYRKGKKDGSSGYVRVEARGQECRIEVHLRCAGLEPGSRCRVYGFVRREGLMDGILIGSCVTGKKSPGAWRYAADLGCRRILGNGVG